MATKQAMQDLHNVLQYSWGSDVLYTVTRLGILAFLQGGPKHLNDIATHIKVLPEPLYRLLRTVVSLGFLEMDQNNNFSIAPAGLKAIEFRDMILHLGEPATNEAWLKLVETVQTGETGWKLAHGNGVFDYYKTHPDSFAAFNGSMTVLTKNNIGFTSAFDWNKWKHIYDIGGGHGLLGYAIAKHSNAHVTVFDMPEVIEGTKKAIETEYKDVAPRLDAVGGDFFKEVPSGGDLYIMKTILHDWNDEDCVKILKTIHRSSGGNAKLLLLELVVPPVIKAGDPYGGFASSVDVHMMVCTGGKERTADEWKKVLDDSGFVLDTINVVERQNMIFANKK